MAPTSHAILGQVPGGDLGYMLTDFLINKHRRRKLLGGGGAAPPGMFGFFTPKVFFPGFLSHSDRILASVI